MSYTEIHLGKLKKVELKENYTLEDCFKEKLSEKGILDLPGHYSNWEECFKDQFNEKYFVVGDSIWEAIEHQEIEDDGDIYDLKENSDGTLSFVMKFYNGGTCLSECLEEELEKHIKEKNNPEQN